LINKSPTVLNKYLQVYLKQNFSKKLTGWATDFVAQLLILESAALLNT